MTDGLPSRCTWPETEESVITASLGRGMCANVSPTMKVALEPSPTTNLTPAYSPAARTLAATETQLCGNPHSHARGHDPGMPLPRGGQGRGEYPRKADGESRFGQKKAHRPRHDSLLGKGQSN